MGVFETVKKQKKQRTEGTSATGRRRDMLRVCILVVFAAVFLFSAAMLFRTMFQGVQEEDAFRKLAESVAGNVRSDTEDATAAEERSGAEDTMPGNSITCASYTALYEQNQDFVGWLTINNTKIDYPVMCTPDDPEYYLRRGFDRFESLSGTPFVGDGGTVDSDCFIIYGHNMKNDTMFSTLDQYRDKTFFQDNPTFTFTTLTETRTYQVFAAVSTRILSGEEAGLRYYEYSGDLSRKGFDELLAWLKDNALYDSDIMPDYGEQILLLSTCSYHTADGRFVAAARRIR